MARRIFDTTPLISLEEFARLPAADCRLELVRGMVLREPPAGYEHGRLGIRIGSLLECFVRERGLGEVVGTDVGFILFEDPPTVRAPDIAFVAAGRTPAGESHIGFAPFAPDLAVEIVSPSNSAVEIRARVFDYLDAGTRLVWVVEPGSRTITSYSSPEELRVLHMGEVLDGAEVLPRFRASVSEIFAR